MSLPRDVTGLLARQHSVAARAQLIALGYSGDTVDGWRRHGLTEGMACGVVRAAGAASTPEQRAMVAVLRCRPDARITGPFVLGMLAIEGFSLGDPFVVLVRPGRRLQHVPWEMKADPDPAADRATVNDVPAVTPTRALIDSFPSVGERRFLVGFDDARGRRLTSETRARRCAARLGPAEQAALDALLSSGALRLESMGERALAPVVAGIEPPATVQYWVTPTVRADYFWPHVGYGLEYLGRRHHGAAFQRRRDADRDTALTARGVLIRYVWHEDLANPTALRADIVATIRALERRTGLA